jgi:hypothetical protein
MRFAPSGFRKSVIKSEPHKRRGDSALRQVELHRRRHILRISAAPAARRRVFKRPAIML